MKNKLTWHTETRKVSELVPNIKNPRVMNPKQVEDLKKSLQKFNLVEIPVIDTNNKVVAGHQRLAILKLLGRENENIEVRIPNRKLSQKEYDQYLLTSNRVHGDWDWEKLAENFDIELLKVSGFDDTDMSHIFDTLEVENDEFDEDKELARIKTPKTKVGEMYQIGRHRVICGDSTEQSVVQRLVGKERVSLIYSDPPYNISYDYDRGLGGRGNYGGHVDDSKSEADYESFLKKTIENALVVSKKDIHCFYWADQCGVGLLQKIYKGLGIENKRVCLWVKGSMNPTPGVAFNKCYESCVYGTVGRPYLSKEILNLTEIMNKEVGTGNQGLEDVQDILDIWLVKRINGSEYQHPTQKPPTLHEKALRRCSVPGDIVLDLFGGSGSTMIACEQLKRTCYLVEQEPIFVDLIIRRYEKLTGLKAKKIS